MREYYPTLHANEKMAAREISWAAILDVLAAPEVSYQANHGAHAHVDATIYQRGALYVVAANKPDYSADDEHKDRPFYAVITVGLRSVEQWTDEDAINRNSTKGV